MGASTCFGSTGCRFGIMFLKASERATIILRSWTQKSGDKGFVIESAERDPPGRVTVFGR
jgi:hypothetical protein